MRKWRNGTFLSLGRELTVLTQEQADYIGVKIDVPFKGGHYRYCVQGSAERVTACRDGENHRSSDLGELFADRARVRDDPGMRARSRRTIWNRARLRRTVCERARPGLASGVHRDKESFPNAKVQKPNLNTSARRRRRPRFSKVCETVQCEH